MLSDAACVRGPAAEVMMMMMIKSNMIKVTLNSCQ